MLRKKLIYLFIVINCLIIGNLSAQEADIANISREELLSKMPNDIVIGDENAPVTIIEYASLSCSHCRDFHKFIYKDIAKNYIDTGKVKFIYRDFPLDRTALYAAKIAHCAGADKYKDFINVIFVTQDNWAGQKNYLEILTNIAKLGGLKADQIDQCIKDKTLEDMILKSRFYASDILKISATPTFFINGELFQGPRKYETFKEVIEKQLNKK